MFIAQKLRPQNLPAYIIYMYQVEDIIRAYGLDLEKICAEYLPRFQHTEEQTAQLREWYENLIRMMREEEKVAHGHLQVVCNTLILMEERHRELMSDPKQTFYNAAYYKALPHIVQLRTYGENKDKGEMETCMDALYGATLLRMQGKELSQETAQALQPISTLLETLNKLYKETADEQEIQG